MCKGDPGEDVRIRGSSDADSLEHFCGQYDTYTLGSLTRFRYHGFAKHRRCHNFNATAVHPCGYLPPFLPLGVNPYHHNTLTEAMLHRIWWNVFTLSVTLLLPTRPRPPELAHHSLACGKWRCAFWRRWGTWPISFLITQFCTHSLWRDSGRRRLRSWTA